MVEPCGDRDGPIRHYTTALAVRAGGEKQATNIGKTGRKGFLCVVEMERTWVAGRSCMGYARSVPFSPSEMQLRRLKGIGEFLTEVLGKKGVCLKLVVPSIKFHSTGSIPCQRRTYLIIISDRGDGFLAEEL